MIKLLTFCITPVSSFLIIKNIYNNDLRLFKIKNLFLLFLVVMSNYITYTTDYQLLSTLIVFVFTSIIYKFILKVDLIKSTILTMVSMIVIAIAEFICSIVIINFVDGVEARSNIYLMLGINVIIMFISVGLSKIRKIKINLQKLLNKLDNEKIKIIFMFFILILFVITILIYIMSNNFAFNKEYVVVVIIAFVFFCLMYIFVREKNEYSQLKNEYSSLFTYVQNFEEWIEKDNLSNHEHKNQLATIKDLTKEKKVKEYISNILAEKSPVSEEWIGQLKTVPNGGIKGIIYYKLIIAQKNNLNIVVDISKKAFIHRRTKDVNDLRTITQLMGIYFDNAIEATMKTKDKKLSLEIYELNSRLNVVIMNSIDENVNLSKVNEKNYSTKGKSRGNGLYYASKLLKKNKDFLQSETKIVNNYYVQKLIVSKKKTP